MSNPTRTLAAIVLGFLSGATLFLLAATLTSFTISAGPSLVGALVAGLAAWAISTYFILRKAATTSAVLCRGFLLGAAEWLALISSTRLSPEDYRNLPNSVPALLGEALLRWLEVAMAASCLIAFAIAYFIGRQARPQLIIKNHDHREKS